MNPTLRSLQQRAGRSVPPDSLREARAAHDEALIAWIRSRGDDEPAAHEAVKATRAALRAFESERL
jgi:hypothetical protein